MPRHHHNRAAATGSNLKSVTRMSAAARDLGRGMRHCISRSFVQSPSVLIPPAIIELTAGLFQICGILQMHQDAPEYGWSLLHRFVHVSSNIASQLLGALSVRDFTFLSHQEWTETDVNQSITETERIKQQLNQFQSAVAEWILKSPAVESKKCERMVDGALACLQPHAEAMHNDLLDQLVDTLAGIRAKTLDRERQEEATMAEQTFPAQKGASDTGASWSSMLLQPDFMTGEGGATMLWFFGTKPGKDRAKLPIQPRKSLLCAGTCENQQSKF